MTDENETKKPSTDGSIVTGSANTMRLNSRGLCDKEKASRAVLNEDMEPLGDPSRLGANDL